MINLPSKLLKLQQSNDLRPLKPFVLLYRNQWNAQTNKYALEDTAIDITDMVIKPNTLSMTLDVNEVAQYNANNITLTLSDLHNKFTEGIPDSYFPDDSYQLYGSRVVLYYGIDRNTWTALFTGVIKDLPTYKPEKYEVDVKLVSPLELLKDIEAKGFSNKVTGESLVFDHMDGDDVQVYRTRGVGVGGFDSITANGTKLFEGVDYEIEQTNAYGLPCYVKITNPAYFSSNIVADYYTWKVGLPVEKIIKGLVELAGYDETTEDIRSVVWNTDVRSQRPLSAKFTIGYRENANNFQYSGNNCFYGAGIPYGATTTYRYSKLPTNFRMELGIVELPKASWFSYFIGDIVNGSPWNGFMFTQLSMIFFRYRGVIQRVDNGNISQLAQWNWGNLSIEKNGNNIVLGMNGGYVSSTVNFTGTQEYNECIQNSTNASFAVFSWNRLTDLDTGAFLTNDGVMFNTMQRVGANDAWSALQAGSSSAGAIRNGKYRVSSDNVHWGDWHACNIGTTIGERTPYIQLGLEVTPAVNTNITGAEIEVLGSSLTLQLANLSGRSILEALQDFALISGYEFGVSRSGVFFFRPRVQTTAPTYVLDHSELIKVDSIKKSLSDFFTKLTLTFAEKPLEFYANSGTRPTPLDKYGIINKDIDKPEIINYDNAELAQAIGPQLIEAYSRLTNQLQVTAKLNLLLELGDIINLKRCYPEIVPKDLNDLSKYERQQTYYRTCKIVGINYNFAKKQMGYTLQDVSNDNNKPQTELYEFVYDFPIQLGAK